MSKLAATQIPKPSDEQAFERASVVLWRCLLKDPNVQRNGRRGQRQNGVDLFGYRNGDANRLVGIQCKLKGDGQVLTENEIREELRKALTFKPTLREYFIITTASDDVAMQELARELVLEQAKLGRTLVIYVWGWNTLEEHISEHPETMREFDATYGAFGKELLETAQDIQAVQTTMSVTMSDGLSSIRQSLERFEASVIKSPGDATIATKDFEGYLDGEIDGLRDTVTAGKPRTALQLLEKLLERVAATASGRILFRIKANIANCHIACGDTEKGTALLLEAYAHAPEEPKAVANKGYALLLRGEWRELTAFATQALRDDPTNEHIAGYLVQAARHVPSVTDPLLIVPEALRTSLPVTIANAFFLRHRGSDSAWRDASRQALKVYPEDEHAQQFAADAVLDEIVQDTRFQRTHLLSPKQKERLASAIAVLTRIWDQTRQTEGVVPSDALGPCANLIVAHNANDDLPKALEVARQGLAVAPDDAAILLRAALAAVEAKDDELAAEAIKKLPADPNTSLLAFRFHAHRGDWEEMARFVNVTPGDIPETEYELVRTMARLAELHLAGGDQSENFAAIIEEVADNARSSVAVAAFARRKGFDDLATKAFENAVSQIGEDTHVADRLMTALEGATRQDWACVANLLDGHIAEDHDGEALRALATAYVNMMPVQRQAVTFYGRLPKAVAGLPFYMQCAGIFHFNRGALKQAETALRKVLDVNPNVELLYVLCATLRRSGRTGEVPALLEAIKVEELTGAPGQKMYLAQMMRDAGFGSRAMAYAYDVLRKAPNDADVALRYFGLVMMKDTDEIIPDVDAVATDVWVRLKGQAGKRFSFLIEEGKDRPGDGVLSPRHPIAAKAMGLRVGDTFVQDSPVGDGATWRIAELKHKHLHALHEMMEHFQTRFSDAQGFYSITMRDGDVQPALDEVRRVSENNRRMADLYIEKHIPLTMVASLLGGDSTGFADYLRSLGETVVACAGTHPERVAAYERLDKRRAAGAVLDTYAAWTAATMDIFDILEGVFGKLVVPQSCVDELRMRQEYDALLRAGSMTMGWRDGQYVAEEHTQEGIDQRVRYMAEQIAKIEERCTVLPIDVPDDPTELASLLMTRFAPQVLDPAYLAAEGYVLLSDDMYFRQAAELAAGAAPGVWLQPVLAYASGLGLLPTERYADLIVQLAWRRHGHLSLDGPTLARIFADDTTDALLRFATAAHFIGTKDADVASHLAVVEEFLGVLWADATVPETRKRAATGILLDRLVRHQPVQWSLLLGYIRVDATTDLHDYVSGWIRGHFLSEENVAAEERRVQAYKAAAMGRLLRSRRRRVILSSSWPMRL